MKQKGKIALIGVLVAMVLVAVAVYYSKRTPFEQRRPRVGDAAPAIDLASLSGQMVGLSEHRGKVVLVNFWASWCPPCKREFKWFQDVYDEYEDRGFAMVAVALDNVSAEDVNGLGITFPVVAANERVRKAYGDVSDVPVSFLVGRDGRIVRKVKKVYPEKALRRDVEAALGPAAAQETSAPPSTIQD